MARCGEAGLPRIVSVAVAPGAPAAGIPFLPPLHGVRTKPFPATPLSAPECPEMIV